MLGLPTQRVGTMPGLAQPGLRPGGPFEVLANLPAGADPCTLAGHQAWWDPPGGPQGPSRGG